MKEALTQLSLSSVEIPASTFDSDIDNGSDSPYPTHQDVPA